MSDVAQWRQTQSLIAHLYIDLWLSADNQEQMPYQLDTSGSEPRYILDNDGNTVGEVTFLDPMFRLEWMRSVDDLIAMNDYTMEALYGVTSQHNDRQPSSTRA